MHLRISFVFPNEFLFSFLSISSEAGLEIDSQQEEEPVQAPDESDLPSTSQDPPSSSSAGQFLLLTTIQLYSSSLFATDAFISNNSVIFSPEF